MTKNLLYKDIMTSKIQEILVRIEKERRDKKEKETLELIKSLMTARKKRPSLEDARVYLEILEQEYPLFSSVSDYELIKLARTELGVELLPKHLFTLRKKPSVNILYEITYFS